MQQAPVGFRAAFDDPLEFGFVLADIQDLVPDENRIVFVEHKNNRFGRFTGYIIDKNELTTQLTIADGGLPYAEGDNIVVENERYKFYVKMIGGKRKLRMVRKVRKVRKTRKVRKSKKSSRRLYWKNFIYLILEKMANIPPEFRQTAVKNLVVSDNNIIMAVNNNNPIRARYTGNIVALNEGSVKLRLTEPGFLARVGDTMDISKNDFTFYSKIIAGGRRRSKKSRKVRKSKKTSRRRS